MQTARQAVDGMLRDLLYLGNGRSCGQMTQLEVAYRYGTAPGEATMRAIDGAREVYGIRRITFQPTEKIVRVEFDASRFKEPVIAGLLRQAGVDLQEKLVLF